MRSLNGSEDLHICWRFVWVYLYAFMHDLHWNSISLYHSNAPHILPITEWISSFDSLSYFPFYLFIHSFIHSSILSSYFSYIFMIFVHWFISYAKSILNWMFRNSRNLLPFRNWTICLCSGKMFSTSLFRSQHSFLFSFISLQCICAV